MHIKSIQLTNFKRFANLRVSGLTECHKFVFLLGPNGCGKSSLFEAFNCCRLASEGVLGFDSNYHVRLNADNIKYMATTIRDKTQWKALLDCIDVQFHRKNKPNWLSPSDWERNAFYLRGAFRNQPDHRSQSLEPSEHVDGVKPSANALRTTDEALRYNYQKMLHFQQLALANPCTDVDADVGAEALRLFRQLQASTSRVFPEVKLVGLGNPQDNGTFTFTRNDGPKWRFSVLSAGEKSVFDLLLDVIVKKETVKDAIYCIDEPELHTHSALQSRLMDELSRLVPMSWQVWIATHSIGIMRWSMEHSTKEPSSVAYLDFGNHNFDEESVITPVTPSKTFWGEQFRVAVGDLADLIIPEEIIVCEGSGSASVGFDADVLQRVFGESHPTTAFVSAGGGNEVKAAGAALAILSKKIAPTTRVRRLYDRDCRTDAEIESVCATGDAVLRRREIENYIFDSEILRQLTLQHADEECWGRISMAINEEIESLSAPPRNKLPDDIKSAAPKIQQIIKKELKLQQGGSNYEAFALAFLVPLMSPSTNVYQELEEAVWPQLDRDEG